MADLKTLVTKYKSKSDDEIDRRRDEIEQAMVVLRTEFMELGQVADYRRQIAVLDKDDVDKQIAALKKKKALLEI